MTITRDPKKKTKVKSVPSARSKRVSPSKSASAVKRAKSSLVLAPKKLNRPKAAASSKLAGEARKISGKAKKKTVVKAASKVKTIPAAKKSSQKPMKRPAVQGVKGSAPKAAPASKMTTKKLKAAKAPVVKSKSKATLSKPKVNSRLLKKIRDLQSQRETAKNIASRVRLINPPGGGDPIWENEPQTDRVGLFVRDPFWLHASWEITRGAVERSQAALAQNWHNAKPVLRLIRLDQTGAGTATESIQAEIEIHGGVRNWYIPWIGEEAMFRVNIGYIAMGRFHLVATSNVVKTPSASSTDATDDHWSHLAPQGEKIFSLSGGYDTEVDTSELKSMLEQRLKRSLGAPELARLAIAADAPVRFRSDFFFDLEVELVFYGATEPHSYVTINDEPVALRPDGTFVSRVPFPERRNVMTAMAIARDGGNQRTVVLGIERNTKIMEMLERDHDSSE